MKTQRSYFSLLQLTSFLLLLLPTCILTATTQPPPLELDLTSLLQCTRTCEFFDAFCQRYEKTCSDPGRKLECDRKRETMAHHMETFGGFDKIEDRCDCRISCVTGPDHVWVYAGAAFFGILFVGCALYAIVANFFGNGQEGMMPGSNQGNNW